MTTPNMSTITNSLEKALQNVSLSSHHPQTSSCSSSGSNGGGSGGAGSGGGAISRTSGSDLKVHNNTSDIAYELNSHIRMPYHWEQCLDLKSGEVYYINWRTGMKSKEDPRTTRTSNLNVGFDDSVELDDESSYESEGSITTEESSALISSSEQPKGNSIEDRSSANQSSMAMEEEHVLVVAGCKNCYIYLMVPKMVEACPKCTTQLIHFASP